MLHLRRRRSRLVWVLVVCGRRAEHPLVGEMVIQTTFGFLDVFFCFWIFGLLDFWWFGF